MTTLRPAALAGPRPVPVLASLIVHMGVLALVVLSPPAARKQESAYRREIAPHEKKLVWYRFNEKLPEVSPSKPTARKRPVRARVKHPSQTIVAKSTQPDPAKQMIVAPGPELEITQDLKAPNLMAFEAKPPEPPLQPKLFVPPPEPERVTETPALEAGPTLTAVQSPNPLEKIPAPRLPPKPFVAPPQAAKRMDDPQLQPGEVRVVAAPLDRVPLPLPPQEPARPTPKTFTPPVRTARRTDAPALLSPGPLVAPQAPNTKLLAALPKTDALPSRPQPKTFTAPQRAPSSATPITPALEGDAKLSAAVVGLNPIDRIPVVPAGSRPAQFSAAPEVSKKGDTEGGVESAKITMSDLMISGRDVKKAAMPNESIVALTRVAPTSEQNLLAAARPAPARPAAIGALKSTAAVQVSGGPHPRFDGRLVYTVAINMPQVTSYSGSWILWYAERKAAPGEERQVSPPEPLRKVDPVYDLSAVEDRVEGKVQLSGIIHTDGYVYGINVLRGVDPRLDNSAMTALRKWEFTPAQCDGNPVDVDIVIEIPFRLRPLNK